MKTARIEVHRRWTGTPLMLRGVVKVDYVGDFAVEFTVGGQEPRVWTFMLGGLSSWVAVPEADDADKAAV